MLIRVLLLLFTSVAACGQVRHSIPEIPEPPQFNAALKNTAALLHQPGGYVRVLVYGQSISVQDWWKDVKQYFEQRYPGVTLEFLNKAIGGFSAERLQWTVRNDVGSFYPDLILFHDYGSEEDYEKIIRIIRSTTTTDVAIQTDHVAKQNQEWHDQHSDVWLPGLCRKYGLALIDVRKYWKQYLRDNNLEIGALLTDAVHLNEHGNYLMAGIIKGYFKHLGTSDSTDARVRRLIAGKHYRVVNGQIKMTFSGNRVDIKTTSGKAATLEVEVDKNRPLTIPGCYYYTRPTPKSTGAFLSRMGNLVAMDLGNTIGQDDWTLTLVTVDSASQQISFSLVGSSSGEQGTGKSNEVFVSRSGQITIRPEYWFFRRHEGDFANFSWLKPGDVIQWETVPQCSNSLVIDGGNPSRSTIVQGISNSSHELTITGKNLKSISEVIIYEPPLKAH